MRFGVREICNVVFRAKAKTKIGSTTFQKGQPVLYIDTAKTSTLEGASTEVYATGGRGNNRLIAWSGEKTLTFTVEDALLSPIGFAILSGAGLLGGKTGNGSTTHTVHLHTTTLAEVGTGKTVDLTNAIKGNESICTDAPIFIVGYDDGSVTSKVYNVASISKTDDKTVLTLDSEDVAVGDVVFVDFYVLKPEYYVDEIQIDAAHFAGTYYVEAETLFRRESDGVDMPAQITIPRAKIASNFTFSMAPTGDPSTFTFTMEAMPDYTYFNPTKKVLCVIQVVDNEGDEDDWESVMRHPTDGEDESQAKFFTDGIAQDSYKTTADAQAIDGFTLKAVVDDETVPGSYITSAHYTAYPTT